MKTSGFIRLFSLGLLLALAGPASAGVYKWTDDQGEVHYSQQPPADRPTQTVTPPPRVTPPPPQTGSDQQDAHSAAAQQQPKFTPEQQEQIRRNCEGAKNNLKVYQEQRRFMDNGKVVILDDETRAARIEEAQKQIDLFCKDE